MLTILCVLIAVFVWTAALGTNMVLNTMMVLCIVSDAEGLGSCAVWLLVLTLWGIMSNFVIVAPLLELVL